MTAAVSLPEQAPATCFVRREELPDDRRFICRTWVEAERENAGHGEGRYYWAWQNSTINGILARPSTKVWIVSPEGDEAIAGWAVVGSDVTCPIVYFLYVRPEARRLGLAKLLLGALVERKDVIYTSRPPRERDEHGVWRQSSVPIPRGWRYMPRAAFLEVPR